MSTAIDDVTVIVVTYNSEAVIRPCLSSIDPVRKLIVVDNASGDNTIKFAREAAPLVEIVRNGENIGFGRACNVGLARSDTKYVLFLNPDTILRPGALRELLDGAERYRDAALLAPALEAASGEIHVSHDVSRVRWRWNSRIAAVIPSGPCCVEFVLGAAMFARAEVMRALGGFDESIFLFYEDDDLCERMRKAGHSIVYLPSARVSHLWGHSSGNTVDLAPVKAWHMTWSRLYVVEKHAGRVAMLLEAAVRLLYGALQLLAYALSGDRIQSSRTRHGMQGIFAYVRGNRLR